MSPRLRLLVLAASVVPLTACGSGSRARSTAPSTAASRPAANAPSPLHVTVAGAGHTPKANTNWRYRVRATLQGKPAAGKLTVQVVDPVGGVHPVLYANTKRKLIGWPFHGSFHDFVTWPGSSRGIPLALRVTVVAGGMKRVVNYRLTPR